MNFLPTDVAAMDQALELAAAATKTRDVPVGALVVREDGIVIGTGTNTREAANDPVGHAEINALTAAASMAGSWRLDGTTLVVTLEPCLMCAGALLQARVSRLVFAAFDDKAGAVGSRWDVLRDGFGTPPIEVVAGVRQEESETLLRQFFVERRAAN